MQQGSPAYLAASDMLRCVRTGEPAAETVFGMPFFEYLATDAQASDVFNRAMAGGAAARASVALEYDWSDASVVADIGGGTGSLLSSVLGAQPHLRGVVFDLPHVAAEARPVIEAAGLSDRCETAGGDFFTEPLPSADVYVLAQILHDWDDERAMAILRNCRRSIAEGGRVLVVEQVLPEGDEPSYGKLIDLMMVTLLGGKEAHRGRVAHAPARGRVRARRRHHRRRCEPSRGRPGLTRGLRRSPAAATVPASRSRSTSSLALDWRARGLRDDPRPVPRDALRPTSCATCTRSKWPTRASR